MAAAMAAPSTGLCFARAHRHSLLPPSSSASKLRVSSGSFSPATTSPAGALGFGRPQLIGFPVIFTTGRPSLWAPHKAPIGPVVARLMGFYLPPSLHLKEKSDVQNYPAGLHSNTQVRQEEKVDKKGLD